MLREIIDTPIAEYASQKLWSKIGAENDARWTVDKKENGDERSYCCMNTTATDLVRIGLLYSHYGNWKGEQIVDTAFVKQSIVPHGNPNKKGNPTDNYGLLWWARNVDNGGDYTADGMYGQYVSVMEKENIVFVRFGKKDYSSDFKKKNAGKIPPLYQYLVREVRKRWGH
jgi:CubicO group peptidase (beta-lactamase class C family)